MHIIWDNDGVISDSLSDQFEWFAKICTILNKPFSYQNIQDFKQDYREPVYPDMYTFLGFDWNREKEIIWAEYNKHKSISQILPFEGIERVIAELSAMGFTHSIASSNTSAAIRKNLDGLGSRFNTIISKDDLPHVRGEPLLKPHPACILLAAERLEWPSDVIYIGDQIYDAIAVQSANSCLEHPIQFIGVTYGFGLRQRLEQYVSEKMLVDTPYQILEKISNLQNLYIPHNTS